MNGTKPTTAIIVRSFRGQQLYLVSYNLIGKTYHWSADRSDAFEFSYYEALAAARRASREYGADCAVKDSDGVLTAPAMAPQKVQQQQANAGAVTDMLAVPGAWLAACGYGTEDRAFPVKRIERNVLPNGRPATMVVVDRDGYEWVVYKELRGAVLYSAVAAKVV